jgi:hypothetical protein
LATAQRVYTPASRTNFDADLATITIPTGITQVNFVGISINSLHSGARTFNSPSQGITVGLYVSTDGGVTYPPDPFISFDAVGGVYTAWAPNTAYSAGQKVSHSAGNVYKCFVPGTSAPSGGPVGTGTDILDGTVHWLYAGITDPSVTFQCDPPLMPGMVVKPHVTQTGTYWLGGVLSADYTP